MSALNIALGYAPNPATTKVTFLNCTGLHMAREMRGFHVGSHHGNMKHYAQQPGTQKLARELSAAVLPDSNRASDAELHVLAFWCNAGEHRSVALSELCDAHLKRQRILPQDAVVLHLGRELWDSCF
jgi:RNase adaptor protein for sRNA GlmZ degradation